MSEFNSVLSLATADPAYEAQQRYRSARFVASQAHDAADCAQLLAALGLSAAEGRTEGGEAA